MMVFSLKNCELEKLQHEIKLIGKINISNWINKYK